MRFATIGSITTAALTLSVLPVAAQDPDSAGIEVTRAVVATEIQDREPVGEARVFGADVGTVYFYTVLEGDFAEQRVEHVWVREGEEVGRVPLTVTGPRWRTWSAKAIPGDWTGSWTVSVVDAGGTELESVDFTVGG